MHLDKGMHASFWLQPANWYTPGDPSKGTEIDVVEFFGRTKKDSHIASFLHWYDSDNAHHKLGGKFPYANRLKKRAETWSNSYHVFSVEWTADAYVFRVDGREFWRETEIVSRAPEYLLLSMLTSDYELEKLTAVHDAPDARRWTGCGSGPTDGRRQTNVPNVGSGSGPDDASRATS